jgi:hypothetical protein
MVRIGAVAAAAAVVIWVVSLFTIGTVSNRVAFADVLAPVADATGEARAVHMVLRMLTRDGECFSYVNLDGGELRTVEVWLQEPLGDGDRGRARLVKSDRLYNFDGQESVLYSSRRHEAYRNVGFDRSLFWPAEWVRHLQHLPLENVVVLAHEEEDGEGRLLLRAQGIATKPLEPAFFEQFDRETEIVWDLATHRLKGQKRWVDYKGERRLFSELVSIDYQPAFDEAVFQLDLPPEVRWGGFSERSLGPREAAQRIFEAAIHRDRDTLELYVPIPSKVDWFMTHSIEVISLGEPFEAGGYAGFYVPYEVRIGEAGIFHTTLKHRLALRNDNPQRRWQYDGG